MKENKYDGYQVVTIPARIHILDIKVLKELHEKYKDFLTEEQNKELEQLIKDGQNQEKTNN